MSHLQEKIAWVTGAGSGIGEASAKALAAEGALVVLTGRRPEPLERVAEEIRAQGGRADVQAGDVTDRARIHQIAQQIAKTHGRIDIVFNNAGMNITERSWRELSADGAHEVIVGNLASAFYVVTAALPIMRQQRDGVLIHTSSWAGKYVSRVAGPSYAASKHGVVAMSHSINTEEYENGIRSTVICPAEIATPILDKRKVPISAEERALLLQSEDLAKTVVFVATQPKHVCINEIIMSPTIKPSFPQ
jgi:NADP-dependent 3-hydroxy acid dehydrogenase YdfG